MVYEEAPRSMAAMAIGPRLRTVDHSLCLAVGSPPPTVGNPPPPLLDTGNTPNHRPSSETARKSPKWPSVTIVGRSSSFPSKPATAASDASLHLVEAVPCSIALKSSLPTLCSPAAVPTPWPNHHGHPPALTHSQRSHGHCPLSHHQAARRLSPVAATSLQPPSSPPLAMNLLPEPPADLPSSAMAAASTATAVDHHGHRSPSSLELPPPPPSTASHRPEATMATVGKSHCTATHCSFFPSLIQAAALFSMAQCQAIDAPTNISAHARSAGRRPPSVCHR